MRKASPSTKQERISWTTSSLENRKDNSFRMIENKIIFWKIYDYLRLFLSPNGGRVHVKLNLKVPASNGCVRIPYLASNPADGVS